MTMWTNSPVGTTLSVIDSWTRPLVGLEYLYTYLIFLVSMLSEITERERAVVECQVMRLKLPQALEYLEKSGFPIKRATYYRTKKLIKERTRERLAIIAAETFEQQHLDRIDELLLIKKEMWENYRQEDRPFQRVMILREIKDIQRHISSYYEATEDFLIDKNKSADKQTTTSEDNEDDVKE